MKWLLCNDIPKPFLFPNALHNALSGQNIPTPKDLLRLQKHTGFDTHVTAPHTQGTGACGWNQLLLMTMPWHSHPHHSTIKPTVFFSLSTLTQHPLAWCHRPTVPISPFSDCVAGTLPEAHKFWLWMKERWLKDDCCWMRVGISVPQQRENEWKWTRNDSFPMRLLFPESVSNQQLHMHINCLIVLWCPQPYITV